MKSILDVNAYGGSGSSPPRYLCLGFFALKISTYVLGIYTYAGLTSCHRYFCLGIYTCASYPNCHRYFCLGIYTQVFMLMTLENCHRYFCLGIYA